MKSILPPAGPRPNFPACTSSGSARPARSRPRPGWARPSVTTYAIGVDNTGLFYEALWPDAACQRLEQELTPLVRAAIKLSDSRFLGQIRPYVTRAEPTMVQAMLAAASHLGVEVKCGLTVSNSEASSPLRDAT